MLDSPSARIPTAAPTNPHLRQLTDRAHDIEARVRQYVRYLSEEQLAWKPAPKVWNTLECFEHITKSTALYRPNLESAIQSGRMMGQVDESAYTATWFGKFFINRFIEPTSLRRVKTFKPFKPEVADIDLTVMDRYYESHATLVTMMQEADGLPLNTLRVYSPLTRMMRFSLGDAFWLLVAHEERHLLQAMRLSAQPGFPSD